MVIYLTIMVYDEGKLADKPAAFTQQNESLTINAPLRLLSTHRPDFISQVGNLVSGFTGSVLETVALDVEGKDWKQAEEALKQDEPS